jgi:hypothetical protein
MHNEDFLEPIRIEIESLYQVIKEINAILSDFPEDDPNVRVRAALSSFIAQFYNGVENILKRIVKFKGMNLPKGENWHIELFNYFCEPNLIGLPLLFYEKESIHFKKLRKFRHIVYHGYSFRLEWELMKSNVVNIDVSFQEFIKLLKANKLY